MIIHSQGNLQIFLPITLPLGLFLGSGGAAVEVMGASWDSGVAGRSSCWEAAGTGDGTLDAEVAVSLEASGK